MSTTFVDFVDDICRFCLETRQMSSTLVPKRIDWGFSTNVDFPSEMSTTFVDFVVDICRFFRVRNPTRYPNFSIFLRVIFALVPKKSTNVENLGSALDKCRRHSTNVVDIRLGNRQMSSTLHWGLDKCRFCC